MSNLKWHSMAVIAIIAGVLAAMTPQAHAATLGAQVDNIATVSYLNGSSVVTVDTPPASFIIEAQRTPSTIEFFRLSPNAPDGVSVMINGTDFSPSGGQTPGDFTPLGPVSGPGGTLIDFSGPVTLAPAETYFASEVIFVRVSDPGQNGDPAVIETLVATITAGNGDLITLRLYESGPDTGEFFAYVPSISGAITANDTELSIEHEFPLTATYQDPFVASEISTDVAGVDPFGRLFDSVTGELINGAVVTIVDDATGQPAQVFGIDGVSDYPSTVTTGGTVTDGSGLVYDLEDGEFLFPIMFPGTYRLVIETPPGYVAPSSAARNSFDSLPNAPFIIIDASYGGSFVLDGTGDVSFDVPLDPQSDITITKEASTQTGAVGDFVRYSINIENTGERAVPVLISDDLPKGFRYQAGTARINGALIDDPAISGNGEQLTFTTGVIPAASTVELSYVTEIAAGAQLGEAVNSAVAVNGGGAPISNRAEAAIYIQEDLLRSRLTIVGRVVEDACDPEEDWPREITDGIGVPGVRLYMETGAYVVTDEDGLFHFEDVEARTHVVQLDEVTIPQGYELVQCEDNTRYAGSPYSKFVDAKGGSVWRANFYLKNNNADKGLRVEESATSEATEYLKYDVEWLNKQQLELAWAYPAADVTPTSRSINIGLKHDIKHSVHLFLNDDKVPSIHFSGRDVNGARTIALSRWRGLALRDGENNFEAILFDQQGNEVSRIKRTLMFVTEVARAEFLPEASRLVADGTNSPAIAVRLTDGAGRPVHKGRIVSVVIEPPYRAKDIHRIEDTRPIDAPLSTESVVSTGPGGIAMIELEPTVQTGKARVHVVLDNGQRKEITALLKPELREWIVVGLAEGGGTFEKSSGDGAGGAPSARDIMGDGRIAVFAKGTIGKDWLVTIAGDTAKGRGDRDDELFDVIDPDARFPLYGDRSTQEFEAQSRYPVFAKVEKGGFKGLFGDYDTGLTDAKLGRYSRRLSGLQTTYEDERFSFSGFAAETNQDFIKDEIAADGTSGPFRLTVTPIVRNSETITIETRDRFRPDTIVGVKTLSRYADYDIDFFTGELVFRLPVPAAHGPDSFNVIVADYETFEAVDRDVSVGGRAAVRFVDGRVELGGTIVHEEGRASAPGGKSDLAAVDLTADITDNTELRLEYGASRRETDGVEESGDAILAEINHRSENLTASAYFNQTDEGFGLNQQTSATEGVRRYGVEASYRIYTSNIENDARLRERFVDARAYREENLETGAERTLTEVALRQESPTTSGSVGLRRVVEKPDDATTRKSLLATTQLRQNFEKVGLTIHASRDQPISGEGDSNFYPKRTRVGLDQRIVDGLTLNVSHEIQDGENASSANTIVGLTAQPWTGASITASTDMVTQDAGRNVGATLGVDQQVVLSKHWSGSFGMTRRQQLDSDGVIDPIDDIVPDDVLSPLEIDQNYTSLYVGAGYRDSVTSGSARFEMRKSELGQRYTHVAGLAREVSEDLSFAGAARVEQENNDIEPDRRSVDARLGAAWRPRGEAGLIAFNRFDIKSEETDGEFKSWKAINNLALNAMVDERMQVSVNHGFKYASIEAAGVTSKGVTQLLGAEARFDITENIDVGFQGTALYSHNSKTVEYSYGPSVGVSPAKNIWISAGWNFEGFHDDDFAAAEFTNEGPYIKLRIKFDQNTAKGLLQKVSPGAGQ